MLARNINLYGGRIQKLQDETELDLQKFWGWCLDRQTHYLAYLTKLAVGSTTHVTHTKIDQGTLRDWKSYPREVRERFEAFAEAALASGVDLASLMGARAIDQAGEEALDAHLPPS